MLNALIDKKKSDRQLQKPRNKNWSPTNNHHSIEKFIEAARNNVKEKIEKKATIKIFQPVIKKTKNSIQNGHSITDADRGGAVVIRGVKDVKEAERQV